MERHNRIMPTYTTIPSPLSKSLTSPSKPSSSLSLPPKPNPSPSTSSPYICPLPETLHRISRRVEDAELSIFDAKKYFNDCSVTENQDMPTNQHASSVSSMESYGKNYRNGFITSAASSEASWNSQTGLLSHPPGSVKVKLTSYSQKEKPKPPPSPGRRMFTLRCPCVGKKSLEIDEKLSEPRSLICAKSTNMSSITNKLQGNQTDNDTASSIVPLETLTKVRISSSTWSKERDYIRSSTSFPPKALPRFPTEVARTITNPIVFSLPNVVNKATKTTAIEQPRESIEVFGSTAPPARIILKTDDEQLSDTSSDLFELESFTANSFGTTSYGRRRDSLDDLLDPCRLVQLPPGLRVNPDESAQSECCYPPSEASVQWSVTTAEGFDRASVANFSSAASEFDEMRYIQAERAIIDKRKAVAGAGGGIGGGLLSCRGDKAVQVRCNSARANRTVR